MTENDTSRSKQMKHFFRFTNEFVDDNHIEKMGVAAYSVYSVIKRHANYQTEQSFPSYTRISERTGLSRTRISGALKRLVEGGYITIEKSKAPTGERNLYTIHNLEQTSLESKKSKKTLAKRVNGKQKVQLNEPNHLTNSEVSGTSEFSSEISNGGLYNLYLDKLSLLNGYGGVKAWSEKTFYKKVAKHNPDALEIAYQLITNKESRDTIKVYLLSPDTMMQQQYPQIKRILWNRKVDNAKIEVNNNKKLVIDLALEKGDATKEEVDKYKELAEDFDANKHQPFMQDMLKRFNKIFLELEVETLKAHGIEKNGEAYLPLQINQKSSA